MKIQAFFSRLIHLRWSTFAWRGGLALLATVLLWQAAGLSGLTARAVAPLPNTPGVLAPNRGVLVGDITGTIFEDVNYGGGAGRTLADSAGQPITNARVELYDSAGNFVSFTNTNGSGQYSFSGLGAGSYTVRVVNSSVLSTRTGGTACANCVPVQTFRTNASSGTAVAVSDHVGGEVPSKVDASDGSTTLAALTTATTTAQSIAAVTVGSGNLSGVDFGFNFDTIVNVSDAGQGSYRQFTLNAFSLGGEALLAQAGNRMSICILPSHPAITAEALPAGKETTIFMIANGQVRPGLNTGYANLIGNNGVATILLTAFTTVRGDHTNIDGTTQTFNVGDTNSAVLGTGGMVGGENNVPLPRLNGPEVQLLVTNPAVNYVIGVVGNHVTIRGMGVQGAGGGWDIYYIDFNGSNNDFALVEQNVLGASAADFTHIGTERNQENLHLTHGSSGAIVRCNLMKDAGDMNLHILNSSGFIVEGNEFNTTVGYPANPNFQTGGPGIRLEGGNNHTITGNLFYRAQRGGIHTLSSGGNTIRDNTFTENVVGGVVVTSGASQVPAEVSQANTISRNSFYKNTGLGIDLNPLPLNGIYAPPEFVTPNNGTLSSILPNQDMDYPIINSASLSGTTLTVQGLVGTTPGVSLFSSVTVEVFVADNIPADQNGAVTSGDGQNVPHGEGRRYIGSCVTGTLTNAGLFNCSLPVPTGITITPGTTQLTATATRAFDTSEFGPNKLVECPVITLAPTSLPNGFTGMFYTQTIQASPAIGAYSYTVISGMPPTGLTLNSTTGVLEGTPSVPGYYSFTVTATLTGTGCSVTQNYTIFINCPGATITVTGTADGPLNTLAGNGTCDLREAIAAANGNSAVGECPAGASGTNSDFIYFWIGTGTPTINITSALPALTGRVVIDGSKCQSTRVELNGAGAGAGVNGLTLTASDSAILSMVINRFSLNGLVLANSSNNVIENCLLGTDATGALDRGNVRDGILLTNATNNRIGGVLAGQGNVISGNDLVGVEVADGGNNLIQGNYIGTAITGLQKIGNVRDGILIADSPNNQIGGTQSGAGNLISGNGTGGSGAGIALLNLPTTGTQVQGNRIGLTGNGNPLGNHDGLRIWATTNNIIGGSVAGAANTIAFNDASGIVVGLNAATNRNAILSNSIFSNGALGIDLSTQYPAAGVTPNDADDGDDGPNRFQNFPILLNVTANQIQGTLDSAPGTYTLQFFDNSVCDPSQHGEGQTFIGEMQFAVTGSGPQLFSFTPTSTLAASAIITATATDSLGNTSEFSECHQCMICPTITFSPATLPNGSVGGAYSQTIMANGGTPPHTFILSSGTTAPPGLTLDATTGVLSGTPTQQGSFTFLVKAFAKDGCFGIQQYTVMIGCTSFTLAPTSLPNGETGTMYSQTIVTNPVGAAANFQVTGGTAPPGLTLNAATGVLAGMPTTPGYYTFTVTAGSGACTASQNYVVFINCHGATITVTTAADAVAADGACSLREAIQAANDNVAVNECPAGNTLGDGLDKIYFYIGTGTPTINVLSQLPVVTQRAVIDGSQCQAIRVELNGANAGASTPGLVVAGGQSEVRGLVVNRFGNVGLSLQIGGNNVVENCYLGTDASGTAALPNQIGVSLQSAGNRVGGTTANQRNVISGNAQAGIYINGANAHDNLVQGNYIGTTANGTDPLGNVQDGVLIQTGSNNSIGGTANGASNLIAYNHLSGVGVRTQPNGTMNNRILSNSIYANDTLGIDLQPGGLSGVSQNDNVDGDMGPNNLQNFPVLTQASPLNISGTLNSTPNSPPNAFTIQFFANPACDPSGYGEGKIYLGQTTVTTDANGNASFSFVPATPLTLGEVVTSTATDTDGNTSEFSACQVVVAACPTITVNPATLNSGTVGALYNQTLAATGGAAPYSFTRVTGTLPPGLTLATTGALSGTPTTAGRFNFTVQATDAGGCSGTRTFELTVCADIVIGPTILPTARVNQLFSAILTQTGGVGAATWRVSFGNLPTGLSLNAATGVLSGTPTQGGTFNFTVEAVDANNCSGMQAYSFIICDDITISPAAVPNARIGQSYNVTLTASGCVAPYTFTRVNGTLPAGLTLTPAGIMAGTPTQAGRFNFTINVTSAAGSSAMRTYALLVGGCCPLADFDNDLITDLSTWNPNTGVWNVRKSSDGQIIQQPWGTGRAPYFDQIVPGDYDGDGITDFGIWRGGDSLWYIRRSSDGQPLLQLWGSSDSQYGDIPVPGDYDNDYITDIAVWRGVSGTFYVRKSSDGSVLIQNWGQQGDIPVPGDYDQDGEIDFAVWRPSNGVWYIRKSSDGQLLSQAWGAGYAPYFDVPVPGDYDGDGYTDIGIWRGQNSLWYIRKSSDGQPLVQLWGSNDPQYGDIPVVGDYDGDRIDDIAVWRRTTATWFIRKSSDGNPLIQQHGAIDDMPVPGRRLRSPAQN